MNILVNLGDFIDQLFRDNNLNINALVGESIAGLPPIISTFIIHTNHSL